MPKTDVEDIVREFRSRFGQLVEEVFNISKLLFNKIIKYFEFNF